MRSRFVFQTEVLKEDAVSTWRFPGAAVRGLDSRDCRRESANSVCHTAEGWEKLTEYERDLLAPKLVPAESPLDPEASRVRAVFTGLINRSEGDSGLGPGMSPSQVVERICAVRNFLFLSRAYQQSSIWQQIKQISVVWEDGGMIEIVVFDREIFRKVLSDAGYAVNRWWDKLPFISRHRNDTARQLTDTSLEPSLHFANDDPRRPTTYWAHVDARSVHFRNTTYASRLKEMCDAGRNHRIPSKPSLVNLLLNRKGCAGPLVATAADYRATEV
jgi:hypothetical protein